MYAVLRCSGCWKFLTIPLGRSYVLCPVCGITISITDAQVYLTCKNREVAEDISRQLTEIINRRQGRDLTIEELELLKERYTAWEREQDWS